jgi:preprotein translocase subunit YajC
MVEALRRGDRVVTAGGIYGTVAKVVSDTEVEVEIADGVKVRMLKGTVQEVVSKNEPVKDAGKGGTRKKKQAEPEESEADDDSGDGDATDERKS